jgi:hypothetical protein
MDADTGQIVAAALTTKEVDDGSEVGTLLNQVAASVASFTGDGAYQPVDEIGLARFVVHLTGMVVSSGVGTATKSPVGHDGVVGGDAALTRPCLL